MKKLKACRVCETLLTKQICFLPDMPLTDNFVRFDSEVEEYIRDIGIYQCGSCGLVQNPADFDHENYYESYEYSAGHSRFAQAFMGSYADVICKAYRSINNCEPKAVLEIGSGDGEQLRAFQRLGIPHVLGIEPSEALVRQSEKIGVPASKNLFSNTIIDSLPQKSFDICLSSYTLDHVRDPADYLRTAHELLRPGGILAFEVHDLSRIAERGEWCLFEHEHTIYMDARMAESIVGRYGFKVHSINPLPEASVRANSLIVIARKSGDLPEQSKYALPDYSGLQERINANIARIDAWIDALPTGDALVGYGAGGRGVMTLAALRNSDRFSNVFDSNHPSGRYSTPKSRVAVSGTDRLSDFRDAWCLVFSFGYIDEISQALVDAGYQRDHIVSLKTFMS